MPPAPHRFLAAVPGLLAAAVFTAVALLLSRRRALSANRPADKYAR
jgi:hypothetical protein